MSVNITESKRWSKNNISTGHYDCIQEQPPMFRNKDILFPIKKPPGNNECFASKCSKKMSKKKKK